MKQNDQRRNDKRKTKHTKYTPNKYTYYGQGKEKKTTLRVALIPVKYQ